jgi:hypothetical protein
VAVKATADELRAEIAVPAPLVEATGEFIKGWQKMVENLMGERSQPPAP